MAENTSPSNTSGTEEIGNWMFSLIPVGVAFAFYIVFVLYARLENTHLFIAFGAGAAAIGLETYWIIRGIRNKHPSTIIMGLAGIGITVLVLFTYLSLIK